MVLTVDKTGIPDDRRQSHLPVYQLGKEVRGPLLESYDINYKFLQNFSTQLLHSYTVVYMNVVVVVKINMCNSLVH